jgi:ElaB/YqjD/DUF883 family membrane-anchored ribosome-binding protein
MAQSQHRGQSDLSEKASEMKDKSIDRLRETGAGEVAGNVKGAVDKSVKDQPMVTLAMAAAVGFVLGALWKS